MYKFLVPLGGFAVVASLATVLIGVIVLRSPDTHANLWTQVDPTYTRTEIALLSGAVDTEAHPVGVALLLPGIKLEAMQSADPGRQVYLEAGCGTCHGLDALGGPVAPPLAGSFPDIVKRMVREGPGGMPVYASAHLTDADLANLATYLRGLEVARPDSEKIAALQRLIYDPSVPLNVLLKGKAAIRRSCGACHAQPGQEDIQRAFSSDAEAAGLVADMVYETNLSLEDATAIAHYMLAVLNGADPMKAP